MMFSAGEFDGLAVSDPATLASEQYQLIEAQSVLHLSQSGTGLYPRDVYREREEREMGSNGNIFRSILDVFTMVWLGLFCTQGLCFTESTISE